MPLSRESQPHETWQHLEGKFNELEAEVLRLSATDTLAVACSRRWPVWSDPLVRTMAPELQLAAPLPDGRKYGRVMVSLAGWNSTSTRMPAARSVSSQPIIADMRNAPSSSSTMAGA